MTVKSYNCPQCNEAVVWSLNNSWRPFCSERCRMIDLGKWANDEYSLPVVLNDDGDKD